MRIFIFIFLAISVVCGQAVQDQTKPREAKQTTNLHPPQKPEISESGIARTPPGSLAEEKHTAATAEPIYWNMKKSELIQSGLTLAYVIISLFTLLAIKRQADHMKSGIQPAQKTAQAAEDNARALKSAERAAPVVVLEQQAMFGDGLGIGVDSAGNPTLNFPLKMTCHNFGRSPAWVTEKRLDMFVGSCEPKVLPTPKVVADEPEVLHTAPLCLHANPACEGVAEVDSVILLYGSITFVDIFNDKGTVNFKYGVHPVSHKLHRIEHDGDPRE